MKVSLSIYIRMLDDRYFAEVSLKYKIHQKDIVSLGDHSSPLLAISSVLSVALKQLKTACSVDIFYESKGLNKYACEIQKAINNLKEEKCIHILRLYHS
jgi:hypothetical protein